MQTIRQLLSLLTLVLFIAPAVAQDTGIHAVFKRNNEIFTIDAHGTLRQLTHDGVERYDPRWSGDSTRTALLPPISVRSGET